MTCNFLIMPISGPWNQVTLPTHTLWYKLHRYLGRSIWTKPQKKTTCDVVTRWWELTVPQNDSDSPYTQRNAIVSFLFKVSRANVYVPNYCICHFYYYVQMMHLKSQAWAFCPFFAKLLRFQKYKSQMLAIIVTYIVIVLSIVHPPDTILSSQNASSNFRNVETSNFPQNKSFLDIYYDARRLHN